MVNDEPIDVHYQEAPWPIHLDWVGVRKLKISVPLDLFEKNECKDYIASIDIFTDLPSNMRGSNLSRSVKVLMDELVLCRAPWSLLEKLTERVLEVHEYSSKALVNLELPAVINDDNFVFRFSINRDRKGNTHYIFNVSTTGITACPSALAVSLYRISQKITHMQRALIEVVITSNQRIPYVEILGLVKTVFSGNLKALLSRADESFLVEKVFENPLFTEDLARKTLNFVSERLKQIMPKDTCVKVKARSFESIHNFDIQVVGDVCW